jgi:hypothetical protein
MKRIRKANIPIHQSSKTQHKLYIIGSKHNDYGVYQLDKMLIPTKSSNHRPTLKLQFSKKS